MVVSSLWLGLLAAFCTCAGLALVRRLPPGDRPRGLLTMGASGFVLYILIEVGYQALGTLELSVMGDVPVTLLVMTSMLLLAGLLLGMVGLAWVESQRGHPGAMAPRPVDVAVMLAVGIGLHNFAEGLSVGQSMATTLSGPGAMVVLGLALHSLLDGVAIAAPVAGQPMRARRLLVLAACAAGPSLIGLITGTTWVGPGLELLGLSMSAGALVYVLRELFRAQFAELSAVAAMWAVAAGLLAGLSTELLVDFGRSRATRLSARQTLIDAATAASAREGAAARAPDLAQSRPRPPASLPCSRNDLTAYIGKVSRLARKAGSTTVTIETDWETTEIVTLKHERDDPSSMFLINGKPFTPADWPRIEERPGVVRKEQRATAWVCTSGEVVIDWSVPRS